MPKLTFDKFTFYIDGAELQKDRRGVRTLIISTFLIRNAVKTKVFSEGWANIVTVTAQPSGTTLVKTTSIHTFDFKLEKLYLLF